MNSFKQYQKDAAENLRNLFVGLVLTEDISYFDVQTRKKSNKLILFFNGSRINRTEIIVEGYDKFIFHNTRTLFEFPKKQINFNEVKDLLLNFLTKEKEIG